MSENPEENAGPTSLVAPKPGRGRPRKADVEISEKPEINEAEQTSNNVPIRGRGRPRKVKVELCVNAAEHTSNIPPKRGRGRPRKSEIRRNIQPLPLLKIKKRRGRLTQRKKKNETKIRKKRKSRIYKIVKLCAVSSCIYSSRDHGSDHFPAFFPLPNDARRSTWMYLAGLTSVDNKRIYICDRHFNKDDFSSGAQKVLKHSAVPTMHLELEKSLELNKDMYSDLILNPSDITFKLHETIEKLRLFKKRHSDKYTDLQLSFYLKHPSAYKLLEKPLGLLSPLELKNELFASPINFVRFSNLVNKKLLMMDIQDRECYVTCVQLAIERNIFYSPKSDKLIGVSLVRSRPSDYVCVLIAHGVNSEWQIPLDMAFINILNHKIFTKNWIEQTIKTYKMLRVKGFAWFPNYADYTNNLRLFATLETLKVDFEHQYCHVFYDLPFLLKLLYFNLKMNNYHFGEFSAKLDDLKELYEKDSKRTYPLAPNLSANSVNLSTFEQLTYEHIKEVFCDDTAAALRTYTEAELIKAEGTAIFVENINLFIKLFDLNAKLTNQEKESIIYKVQDFLKTINNDQNNYFVYSLSLIMDIYREDPDLFTKLSKYLLNNYIHKFVDNILNNSIGEKPTSIKVEDVFRKSFIENVLKPIKKNVSFKEALNLIQNELTIDLVCLLKTTEKVNLQFKPSDYKLYMLEREDRILYVAGYIMKKCLLYHECNILKQYVNKYTMDDKMLLESIQKDIDEGNCSMIKNDFVEFIEALEIIFLIQFPKLSTKDLLVKNLLKSNEMQAIKFTKACPCFPLLYAKELFIRIRVDYVLSYNNMNNDAKSTLLQNISL